MESKVAEFNGETFVRNPKSRYYFRRETTNEGRKNAKQLHRVVWEFFNGKIPPKYHVHHIDGDIDNNDISNLDCIPARKHLQIHSNALNQNQEYCENRRKQLAEAQKKAMEWHSSEEGREWHRKHAAISIGKVRENRETRECEFCKREYAAMPWQRYCCQSCAEKSRRRRIAAERRLQLDD